MAYRIKSGESARRMLRRIARSETNGAIDALANAATNRPKAVHDARKRVKKLRALVRLVRERVAARDVRRADERLRDAGRKLSPARDASALVLSLDALREHFASRVKPTAFDDVRARLLSDKRKAYAELRADDDAFDDVTTELAAVRDAVRKWKPRGGDAAILADGVRRSYRAARRRFRLACDAPTDVALHEWRKATKAFGYHVRAIEPLWKPGLGGLRAELERLAGALGDHHDLAVLREAVTDLEKDDGAPDDEVAALVALVDRRREELWDLARSIGGPLFAERPKALGRRVAAYVELRRRADR